MHELCKLLADGQFHSGSQLGCELGITRAGVWKKIKKMQQLGMPVTSQTGLGYRLEGGLRLIDQQEIRDWLADNIALEVLVETDSTNAQAAQKFRLGQDDFLLVAETQSAGRGRRGRDWHSPYASNLYMTYCWPVSKGAAQLEALSLAVGLAIFRALQKYDIPGLGLKWPNDLLVGEKKLAGILVELVGDISDRCGAIIGIGINVNMTRGEGIEQPWTSLALLLGRQINRNQLLAEVFSQLQDVLRVQQEQGFAALQQQWEQAHLWNGKNACICHAERQTCGTILGIDQGGQLRMQVDGQEQKFAGGELSLRLQVDY